MDAICMGDISSDELEYHENLYSGFAQQHFAKPAVRSFRRHLVKRIVHLTGATHTSRVLSLGCGIGDTELLLAPFVSQITGIDYSSKAILQAKQDAERGGFRNVVFQTGDPGQSCLLEGGFDVVMAVFFLHHLQDQRLERMVALIRKLLSPRGAFYSLDPNQHRLSGAIGRVIFPKIMRRYHSPDERELVPGKLHELFVANGFAARIGIYDFFSTPLAGLLPSAVGLYRVARMADELLVRMPLLKWFGSNFEIVAHPR
jgi:SAM-dependent methyltransferase